MQGRHIKDVQIRLAAGRRRDEIEGHRATVWREREGLTGTARDFGEVRQSPTRDVEPPQLGSRAHSASDQQPLSVRRPAHGLNVAIAARREGAFLAYLRQAVMNRIRNELRRSAAQPSTATFDEFEHEHEGSPFEDLLALETCERYEGALGRLSVAEREAVIGRVELGASYDELAANLGKPSADAARVAVARALVHLAKEMGRDKGR